MQDPILNRNFEETKELQTRWSQFRDFCHMAMKGSPVTPQAEMKFLELKSRIAMLHDSFLSGLKHSQKTGQNIMQIVSDCILLKRVSNYTDAEKQKFEFDWNECFLLLNEQVSALDEERKRLESINERSWKAKQRKEIITAKLHNFFTGTGLKASIVIIVLIMLIYVVPNFIWSYENIPTTMPFMQKPYDAFVDKIWRPFFDPNIKYTSMQNLQRAEDVPVERFIPNSANAAQLTPEYFKSRVAAELLGTAPSELKKEFVELFDKRLGGGFETEYYDADQKPVRFFYIMFQNTPDAVRFVDVIKEGVGRQSSGVQQRIRQVTYVGRSANLVIVAIGDHVSKDTRGADHFKLKKEVAGNQL